MLNGEDFQRGIALLNVKELRQLGCLTDDELDQAGPRYLNQAGFGGKGPLHRNATSWTDLLQYTLATDDRTRHAVMLLIPITLLLGVVCALVFLAVQMPAVAPFVVAGLLAPFVFLARRSVRKPTEKKSASRFP